jgi:hypothetical protein
VGVSRFLQNLALCSLAVAVPLHVVRGTGGEPRLGIDLTVGADAVRVLLDTGSPGLRLLAQAVHGQSASRTGQKSGGGYGSGLELQGEEALASVSLGSARGDRIPIELVDGYSWDDGDTTRKPEMFGELFPGILGLDMVTPGICCSNPLPALANGVGKQYIVHAAFDGPQLVLDPDASMTQNFTMVDVGGDGWPQGCIDVEGNLPYDFCGPVLFDTGTPAIVISGPGIDTPGRARPGSTAHLRVADWSHDFVAGRRMRIIVHRAAQPRIVIGLSALQEVDVLFDFNAHKIGLRSL